MVSTEQKWPDFNAIPADQYVKQRELLLEAYRGVRAYSRKLSSHFTEAEHQIQSMPDASPTKWHLAHTTWFFETFILKPFKPEFEWFDEEYRYLFNSYYNAIGSQYPRPRRGLITRPYLEEVWRYRDHIDGEMERLLGACDDRDFAGLAPTLVLGLNHEQQHQELLQTDIKHALFQSAGEPSPGERASATAPAGEARWIEHEADRVGIGYAGDGFCFDNELARHEALLQPFEISDRLVTAGEWLAFMEDGGYDDPLLWLSDGWQWKSENAISSPLYWRDFDRRWHSFTLQGRTSGGPTAWVPVDPAEPVRHVSYYEADAFAAWRGARLPRESEWEAAASSKAGTLDCAPLKDTGTCWEWTQSAYGAYPGFRPTPGAAGEYNGKFMVNQMVLRGSSTATPEHHSRLSYRNFFYPHARWQYTGVRLAHDL